MDSLGVEISFVSAGIPRGSGESKGASERCLFTVRLYQKRTLRKQHRFSRGILFFSPHSSC
jgi:hypothetical protein